MVSIVPPPFLVESKKEREGGSEERSGVDLAYFNSVEEALVMLNHDVVGQ